MEGCYLDWCSFWRIFYSRKSLLWWWLTQLHPVHVLSDAISLYKFVSFLSSLHYLILNMVIVFLLSGKISLTFKSISLRGSIKLLLLPRVIKLLCVCSLKHLANGIFLKNAVWKATSTHIRSMKCTISCKNRSKWLTKQHKKTLLTYKYAKTYTDTNKCTW